MRAEDLLAVLADSGLPVAYHHWADPPHPPYLVYLFTSSDDLFADGTNYAAVANWQVELYSDRKDQANEEQVEGVLKTAGLTFQKREMFIESEELYQTIYSIQTI